MMNEQRTRREGAAPPSAGPERRPDPGRSGPSRLGAPPPGA